MAPIPDFWGSSLPGWWRRRPASGHGSSRSAPPTIDARTLRLRLLDELRRAVGFDHHVWVLTDPETTVGAAPLAAVPNLADVPRLIRLRYLTAAQPWTTLSDEPVALLAEATDGDLSRSLALARAAERLRRRRRRLGGLRDRYGCWAFLELWRTGGRRSLPTDAALLAGLAPVITTALRHAQARTFAVTPPRERPRSGPLVLLLSPDLDVMRRTPGTEDPLRLLVPRDDPGRRCRPAPTTWRRSSWPWRRAWTRIRPPRASTWPMGCG